VETHSLARRQFPAAAALLMVLLHCGGCATAAKSTGAEAAETGPPTRGPGMPVADEGMTHSCSAPASSPRGSCGGCSVNCGDKQAFCRAGEEWPSGGQSCQQPAVCNCR